MRNDTTKKRQRQIMAEIAKLGYCLPGSLVQRTSCCGNPTCVCHTDPSRLHGPYQSWTRKVNGKTVTRNLSAAQVAQYQPWFHNARHLRTLVAELEALSVQAAEQREGWGHKETDGNLKDEPARETITQTFVGP